MIDYKNQIEIMLIQGELCSIESFSLTNNFAILGKEIIQFTTATLLGINHYKLEGLIRGCFGTESAIFTHVIGEDFVLLNDNLTEIPAFIGIKGHYKIDELCLEHTYLGENLKPLAVVHPSATKNQQEDIEIKWVRRSRAFYHDWGNEAPLIENKEEYEVDILKNCGTIRTVVINKSFLIYNRDEILLDFVNYPESFEMIIYQKSDLVGRGRPKYLSYIQ